MTKTQTEINAEVRLNTLRKEIDSLFQDYQLAMMEVTKKVIMEKIYFILEEIEELKEVIIYKYTLIFDGDTIFIETNNSEYFRNELIELLDVNDILSYETLSKIDIDSLMIITQIEMTCEIKIKEVL